ncbi:MAG: ABC transporter ATP-binding protein [Deltaproteobacteria bacterium]|nr:ABC transporter ATP-binding protein [Deltaproteobacteria bacterium]
MPRCILRASAVVKRVPTAEDELTILDGIDLTIDAGAQLAVVGESGSGKTTLLSILAGLDLPTSGDVWLDGDEITALDEEQRARVRARSVGFVFQSFQLIDSLTALENVMLPLELRGNRQAREDARGFLERVGLAARTTHYPRQLSGGEQQRVAIARAFASGPKVLFVDEPTGNLDTATGARIVDLLFGLNREAGTTLVLVTHDAALARRCADVVTLHAGRMRVPGEPAP